MATTGNTNKATNGSKDESRNGATASKGVEDPVRDAPSQEDQIEKEESERQENALAYGNKVNKNMTDKGDNTLIESDADMANASWLISNGYAEMHATQEGLETYNYILLNEDGLRALSSYNEDKAS